MADLAEIRVLETAGTQVAGYSAILSATGAEFALPVDLQTLACYYADGRLLISKSHRGDPRILAYAGRLERLGRNVRFMYVEMAMIKAAYDAAKAGAQHGRQEPQFSRSAMQSYAINLFRRAAQRRASDIHLRVTDGQSTQILFRVLGDLEVIEEQVSHFGTALCSTIYQAMTDQSDATFVISQPQDGRVFDASMLPGDVAGIRVATTPQAGGHVMVLRLLYKVNLHGQSLSGLGFSEAHQRAFANLRRRPTGIIVNSGPTGAGKSTTLQCALMAVIKETAGRKNIITVEDPPEYPIPGAVQTPVGGGAETDRSVSFQTSIRAAMRLDPDIIMIGEMRDEPSARLAIAAAMTGHQVWTTLHANYALDIIDRLMDLGVPLERMANTSVLAGMVSQRLVKSLCPHCRIPFKTRAPDMEHGTDEVKRLNDYFKPYIDEVFARGKGCEQCAHSGYTSRTVLAEVVETTEGLMALIAAGDRTGAARHWREHGGRGLAMHAMEKVRAGLVDPFDAEDHIAWN